MAAYDPDGSPHRIVAKYPYHDERGVLLFEVVRFEPKSFAQRRPDPHGGYVWGMDGVRRVPYRLPQLLNTIGTVYVTEGEKDADRLADLGLAATCNPCGAGNWRPEYAQHFAGRDVSILADNDGAGLSHADDVARSLYPVAKSVRVVWLAGVQEKGDVSDWLDAGHTIAGLEQIAAQTPLWCPAESEGAPSNVRDAEKKAGAVLRCFAEITPEPLKWLWPGRIPLGKLTLLVGDPGLGKSLVTIDVASSVTRGAALPDGTLCESGSVIFLSAEDDPADTIRPRLDAAGANVSSVHLLDAVRVLLQDGSQTEKSFSLETDVGHLEDALLHHSEVRLIVIDPITAYLGGIDSNKNAEVRGLLAPLAGLAARHGVAILGVTHLPKSRQRAVHSVIGSIAFAAAARAVWAVTPDPENSERRLMLPVKQNLAANTGGLAFRVEAPSGVPLLAWEPGDVPLDANELLGGLGNREGQSVRRETAEWLRELLIDGPLPAQKIRAEAADAGYSWHTVRDAATVLRVRKTKSGFASGWEWSLPECAASEDAVADVHKNGTFERESETTQDNLISDCEDAAPPRDGTFAEWDDRGTVNDDGLLCSRCGNREQNLAAARYHYNKLCPMLGKDMQ